MTKVIFLQNRLEARGVDQFTLGNFNIKVFSEVGDIGKEASAIFAREIRKNRDNKLKTVFILPTGSTPITMYDWITRRWKKVKNKFIRTFKF